MPAFISFLTSYENSKQSMHILKQKAMGKLIIDGKNVYEIDEECLKKRKVPPGCKVEEAIRNQKKQTPVRKP